MKYARIFFLLTFVTVLIVVGVSVYLKKAERSKENTVLMTKADLSLNKVNYREVKDNRVEWELKSDSVEYFKDNDIAVFHNVYMTVYGQDGSIYKVKGKKGRYEKKTGNILLSGDVVGNSEGYSLKTDSLKYKADGRKILSDDKVLITGADIMIEGVGLFIDIEKDILSLRNDVNTTLVTHKGQI